MGFGQTSAAALDPPRSVLALQFSPVFTHMFWPRPQLCFLLFSSGGLGEGRVWASTRPVRDLSPIGGHLWLSSFALFVVLGFQCCFHLELTGGYFQHFVLIILTFPDQV